MGEKNLVRDVIATCLWQNVYRPTSFRKDKKMDDLKLAALMCSKVCHDLISPVGALSNGVEVLSEDDDPEMREHAMRLLENSAGQAAAKLKFARLAYGSSGSRGAQIDLRDGETAVKELHDGGKINIIWDAPAAAINKDTLKVLMNLTTMACDAIPRGGKLEVVVKITGGAGAATVTAAGPKARLAEETRAGLEGRVAIDELDVRTILPHISGLLARDFGQGIDVYTDEETVKFSFTFPE